jgi:hypothetical protein
VIFANKADMISEVDKEKVVDEEEIKKFCDSVGIKYFLTSAKTEMNV